MVLNTTQLPSHTHTATATAVSTVDEHGGHSHYINFLNKGAGDGANAVGSENGSYSKPTSTSLTGITVATTVNVSNANTGSNVGHANIQPTIAAYYIMYIP